MAASHIPTVTPRTARFFMMAMTPSPFLPSPRRRGLARTNCSGGATVGARRRSDHLVLAGNLSTEHSAASTAVSRMARRDLLLRVGRVLHHRLLGSLFVPGLDA